MTVIIVVTEIVGAAFSGSLALLADAGHALTDSVAIGLALLATWVAQRPASLKRTFGFERAEVLAAAANALLLWVIAAGIGWAAAGRLVDGFGGDPVEVDGGWVLLVGGIGLAVNIAAAYLLRGSSARNLNVEAVFRHVIADLLVSVAVMISAAAILIFGWWWVDPALSVAIAVLIVLSSWKLVASVFGVLIEGVPKELDVDALCSDMEEVPGITVMHDVHVWTVTSGYIAMSAHVLTDPSHCAEHGELLTELRRIAKDRYGISHVTLQLETSEADCTEDHHLDRTRLGGRR